MNCTLPLMKRSKKKILVLVSWRNDQTNNDLHWASSRCMICHKHSSPFRRTLKRNSRLNGFSQSMHVSENVEISQVKGFLRSTSLYTCIVTQLKGWEAGWWKDEWTSFSSSSPSSSTRHCHVETLCPCRHTLPWVAEGTGKNTLEHFSSKKFQGFVL